MVGSRERRTRVPGRRLPLAQAPVPGAGREGGEEVGERGKAGLGRGRSSHMLGAESASFCCLLGGIFLEKEHQAP